MKLDLVFLFGMNGVRHLEKFAEIYIRQILGVLIVLKLIHQKERQPCLEPLLGVLS